MYRLLLIALLVSMTVAAQAAPVVLYVSPRGNDAWSGALAAPNKAATDGPLATLAAAREVVRKLKDGGTAPEGVTVQVRGGVYELAETFKLTAADAGTEQAPVTYMAYPGEKPLLLGGRTISNFVPHQGKILKADLSGSALKGVYFRQLFYHGKRQNLARYPNFDPKNPYGGGWAYVEGKLVSMYADIPGEDKRTLKYKPADVREMARPAEAEVFIFPRYNWWNNVVRIESIDRDSHTVKLAGDASYAIRPGDRYYVRNAFEELDAPGEWYLDKETSTLYFWPPGPLKQGSVSAPALENLVELRDCAWVTLRGFVLEGCEGHGVIIGNSRNCLLAGNTIRNTVGRWDWGLSAVTVSGTGNGVVGNDIHDTGGHGISLSGGDRKTLTASSNYAENNYIHHVGQMYKQGVGISMHGVGLRASRNLIHDGPRMGIMFSGNNLVIELNEIRHVNLETEDTGAVYTGGRDWISSRGSVIRNNYFHDILGYGHDETGRWVSPRFAWGVYLDDNAGGVDVIGNILVRCPRALVHLHNGRDNVIEGNVMVGGTMQQVEYNGWTDKSAMWLRHLPTMLEGYNSVKGQPAWANMRYMDIAPEQAILPDGKIMAHNFCRRNIMYFNGTEAALYRLGNVNFDFNEFDHNLVYSTRGPVTMGLKGVEPKDQWAQWQQLGRDTHSIVADPLFVNPAKDDYRLKPDSPAFKLGFKRIPVNLIGPCKSADRASWPIVQAEGAREHPLVSSPVTAAAPRELRFATPVPVPRAQAAPQVDGRLAQGEWPAAQLSLQESPGRQPVKSPPCSAALTYDSKYLYVALKVPLRPTDKLQVGKSWGEHDGAEVCVQSLSSKQPGPIFVLHGFTGGQFESVSDAGAKADAAKKLGAGTLYAAQTEPGQWTGEWAIPLQALGLTGKPGAQARFNLGVRRTEADEWVCWAGTNAQNWVVDQAGLIALQ